MKLVNEDIANRLIILRRHFNDVDRLAEALNSSSRRQIQLTQLSFQRFQCDLLFVEFDEAQFFFAKSTCPFRCAGEKLAGYQEFSYVLQANDKVAIAHGSQVAEDHLFGFDPLRPIDVVMPSDLIFCNVQIKQAVFEEYLQIANRSDIDRLFLGTNVLYSPNTLPTIRIYFKQLHYLVKHQLYLLKLPYLKKLILEDFIPLLIDAIPPIDKVAKPIPILSRARIVKQAEDYMMANLDRPLTLKDICEALHVSSRPLFYGFREMFGLSPMAYLKVQRLHYVRRSLKVADPKTTNVMSIASRFGFWSAGHFARDYKMMFGELPSETIKQLRD